MLKFVYKKKEINECKPELIRKLKNPEPDANFWDLANEFGTEEVLDAMYAIVTEKDPSFSMEDSVLNLLSDCYLDLFTEAYSETMNNDQFSAKIA